ncbi:MAG: sodium:proton antiporter [Nocardia sp.]|nr:sodium:proton antiporter [Nocardia sp.]
MSSRPGTTYAARRSETEAERLDRNLSGLLQELRVVQTGVQLLTGFLLTLPFQARFQEVPAVMRDVYLTVVVASIAATVLLTAPVASHRLLFRRHRLDRVVRTAHHFALAGLMLLGLALTGVAVLIFDTVAGATAATVAGAGFAVLFTATWIGHPWWQRLHR